MARPNAVFVRGSCGGETLKWQGQCPVCGEGNSLEQRNPARTRPAAPAVAVSLGGTCAGCPALWQRPGGAGPGLGRGHRPGVGDPALTVLAVARVGEALAAAFTASA